MSLSGGQEEAESVDAAGEVEEEVGGNRREGGDAPVNESAAEVGRAEGDLRRRRRRRRREIEERERERDCVKGGRRNEKN